MLKKQLLSSICFDLIHRDIMAKLHLQWNKLKTFLQQAPGGRANGNTSTKKGENKKWETRERKKTKRRRLLIIKLSGLLSIRTAGCWQQLVPLVVLQLETAVMSATCAASTSKAGSCSEVTYICPRIESISYARVERGVGITLPSEPQIKGSRAQRWDDLLLRPLWVWGSMLSTTATPCLSCRECAGS